MKESHQKVYKVKHPGDSLVLLKAFHFSGLSHVTRVRDSGRHDEAIVIAKSATEQEPDNLVPWLVLTSSYGLSGQDEKARGAAQEIVRISPDFSVAQYERRSPQKDRTTVKRYCDALRKAGLPD